MLFQWWLNIVYVGEVIRVMKKQLYVRQKCQTKKKNGRTTQARVSRLFIFQFSNIVLNATLLHFNAS